MTSTWEHWPPASSWRKQAQRSGVRPLQIVEEQRQRVLFVARTPAGTGGTPARSGPGTRPVRAPAPAGWGPMTSSISGTSSAISLPLRPSASRSRDADRSSTSGGSRQDRADQAAARCGQRGERDGSIELIELARRRTRPPYRPCLLDLVDERALADARVPGDQQQPAAAAAAPSNAAQQRLRPRPRGRRASAGSTARPTRRAGRAESARCSPAAASCAATLLEIGLEAGGALVAILGRLRHQLERRCRRRRGEPPASARAAAGAPARCASGPARAGSLRLERQAPVSSW